MPITPCNCAGLRLLLGLVLAITTWLSLTPQLMPLPNVALADKWAHLANYMLLALLVDASWPATGFDWRKWAALLVYGMAIELIQSKIPNRMFSLGDIGANLIGIGLYAFAILPIFRLRGNR
jgi:VanZ family protein